MLSYGEEGIMVNLGFAPTEVNVTLAKGGDFVATLRAEETWPTGLGIELHLSLAARGSDNDIVWPATINGNEANWEVDKLVVESAIDAGVKYVRLHYVETDGTDLVWGKGKVSVV